MRVAAAEAQLLRLRLKAADRAATETRAMWDAEVMHSNDLLVIVDERSRFT